MDYRHIASERRNQRRRVFSQRATLFLTLRLMCALILPLAIARPEEEQSRSNAIRIPQPPSQLTKVPHPFLPGSKRWQAGVHYSVLTTRVDKVPVPPDKIEVREFFMYTSPGSRDVQPYLRQWIEHKPTYVEFARSPAIVFPHARLQARMYLTLEALNRLELQSKLYSWVNDPDHLQTYLRHYASYDSIPVNDQILHFSLNLRFARENGIDERRFVETYTSKQIDSAVFAAQFETYFNNVINTSTFVIDGKYSTSVGRLQSANTGSPQTSVALFRSLFDLISCLVTAEAHEKSLVIFNQPSGMDTPAIACGT